jgi:LuxR family maltose regulon positive regulatory protein
MAQGHLNRGEGRRIIERPRLLRLLDETDARIILLVAPAGYGKTTLARQWLNKASPRGITYRPGAGALDTVRLAAGIAERATELVEHTGQHLRRRLQLAAAPSIGAPEMARLLADDLRTWPSDAWLVIDDLHLFAEPDASVFMESLVDAAPVHFFLTSRTRPPWVTPRRLVYGEIVEVGREALAFTRAEAAALLERSDDPGVADLVAVSGGWPAVIGLAAHSADPLATVGELPTTLYEYLADELYHLASPKLQRALHALATAADIETGLLHHILGRGADKIARAAIDAGFLQPPSDGSFELHPLLRTFLLRKARQSGEEQTRRSALQVADYYLHTQNWDSAFETIQQFALRERLDALLAGGLETSLAHGRLATLGKWLELAQTWRLSSPTRDIAEAEFAFRHGDYEYAGARLESAIRLLPQSARLAHASFRLGQAKQFLSLTDEAITAYRVAEANATTTETRRNALWGLFTLACETTGLGLEEYMRAFQECGPLGADDALRLANGHLALEVRRGELARALRKVERLLPHLSRATDPMVRTSFLNAVANAYLVAGRYEEALSATSLQITDANRFRLDFVLPHAFLNRAATFVALRRTAEAVRAIEIAERHFGGGRDTFAETNLVILKTKLAIADDCLAATRAPLERRFAALTGTTLDAEVAALLALVTAATGDVDEARKRIAVANELPNNFDTRSTTAWAAAICSLGTDADAAPALELFAEVLAGGYIDPFVTAYRACPTVLRVILESTRFGVAEVSQILRRTNDMPLLERSARREGSGLASLSAREVEVSELLARGMSNREIADVLCITEVTAKAHVRHILEKLGARSRTQAALLFAGHSLMHES